MKVDNFIKTLLYHVLRKQKKLKKEGDLEALKDQAKEILPKTCDLIKRIRELIDEKNYDEAYSELWDLNVLISTESKLFPVLVLDEFNLLSTFGIKKPFGVLGQKIMVQQKTLFILSSSTTLTAKQILSEKLSLLFGGFEIIDIGPFTPYEAKDFVKRECRRINISEELKDFLMKK